jgi:isochorismate synthase EntC
MERPKLDEWLLEADKVLLEEEMVLEGLKMALERGWTTPEQVDQELLDRRTTPDIAGRDI